METAQLLKIKEGDLVWIENRWHRKTVKHVVRVTPTLIVLDGLREYNSYKRDGGYAYGRSWDMDGEHIIGFARKSDLKKQEEEQARKQAVTDAKQKKQEEREALRQELSHLFLSSEVYVQSYTNGTDKVTSYGINGLSETQVRRIARLLKRKV